MAYVRGTALTQKQLREAGERLRAKAAELARLEAALDAKLNDHRIPKHLRLPVRTYKPLPETLAAAAKLDLSSLPEPIHGGYKGLRAAAKEAARVNPKKTRKHAA